MPEQIKPIVGSNARETTRPVPVKARELLNAQQNGKPEWIRAPRGGGVEFYTGLSRARLYQGAKDGEFRSVSIRKPGQSKGCRLWHLQSILNFIERCEQEAAKQGAVNQ
jgi:hypothetical protein